MLLPWVTGLLGGRFGMRISLLIVPAALVGAAALFAVVVKWIPRRASVTST
jgi:hypothetical protein